MKNILFIGATAIKERTSVHSNIDDKLIMPEIKTCQDMYILPALGTALYVKLQTGIENATLSNVETALLNDYVTDALVYYVLSELPVGLSFQFYNKGLVRKTSDNSDQPNMQDFTIRQNLCAGFIGIIYMGTIDRKSGPSQWGFDRNFIECR